MMSLLAKLDEQVQKPSHRAFFQNISDNDLKEIFLGSLGSVYCTYHYVDHIILACLWRK
jgi:hypothetical protein